MYFSFPVAFLCELSRRRAPFADTTWRSVVDFLILLGLQFLSGGFTLSTSAPPKKSGLPIAISFRALEQATSVEREETQRSFQFIDGLGQFGMFSDLFPERNQQFVRT